MKKIIKNPIQGRSLSLMIDPTNECQLNCSYCFFGQKGICKMNSEKTAKSVLNFVDAFSQNVQNISVHYMGGEPLLGWKQILYLNNKLRPAFKEREITFSWGLTSNLVGLSAEKAKHMVSEKANIHCSIDGPEEIQNKNRPLKNGKGSFKSVTKNVKRALQITPHDTVRVTVCPEDAGNLIKISGPLFKMGFQTVGLFPAYNMGWDEKSISTWGSELLNVMEWTKKEYGSKRQISTIIKPAGKKNLDPKPFSYCGAGRGLWAFDVRGLLYHCHHFTNNPEYALVDPSISTTEEILSKISNSSIAPQLTKNLPKSCAGCHAKPYCNGGCWANNFLVNKESNKPETIECEMRKMTVTSIGNFMEETYSRKEPREKMFLGCNCDTCQRCDRCDRCDHCDICQKCDSCESHCEKSCQSEDICTSRCENYCQECDGSFCGCDGCDNWCDASYL